MNTSPPESVRHDFSAVNSYVDAIQEKHTIENARRRAGVFSTYALYGSGILIAAGIAAFLAMWGYSLLTEKPEPKVIEVERIVERPTPFSPTIVVQGGVPGAAQGVDKAIVQSATEKTQTMQQAVDTSQPEGVRPVFNFTIFKSIPFDPGGLGAVTVGMRYPDSSADEPEYQWCYVERAWENRVGEFVELAIKAPDGLVQRMNLTEAKANRLATTVETLRQAQGLCIFQ